MAKERTPRGVPNRHIFARASYLYQAAAYMATQTNPAVDPSAQAAKTSDKQISALCAAKQQKATQNMSRHIISSMRSVTLKAQIRQSADMKRTICKYCDTLLIEGQSCTSTVENLSKGRRKPWADVLVIKCRTCDGTKRYPVSAPRQKRRELREPKMAKAPVSEEVEMTEASAT